MDIKPANITCGNDATVENVQIAPISDFHIFHCRLEIRGIRFLALSNTFLAADSHIPTRAPTISIKIKTKKTKDFKNDLTGRSQCI